jgi:hypothetical protein
VSHVYFLPHGVTVNGQYYNNLLTMLCGKWFWRKDLRNCQRSSYCLTILVHIWQIWQRWHWQQWAGKSRTTLLGAQT